MTGNQDPGNWPVPAEFATEDDIATMESLASGLLSEVPAVYHRYYGYETEGGSLALFSTTVYEEEADQGSRAAVTIAKDDFGAKRLEMEFGYNNELGPFGLAPDADLGELTAILQDLLDNGNLQQVDNSILSHVQSIVFCLSQAKSPAHIETLPSIEPGQKTRPIGDIIRSQVDANTASCERRKDWLLPLGEVSVLNIVSVDVLGELSGDEDISSLPRLQISYEDRVRRTTHLYSRYHDGETELDVSLIPQTPDPEPITSDAIEDEVIFFREELGLTIPEKHDVLLLTGKLLDAATIVY